jgi:hypothetical protein
MPVILVLVALLLCAIIILAAEGVASSSVIVQQEEEEKTSLREKGEDLAGSVVSDVLDDSAGDEGERENDYGDAEDESNQDATVTANIDPNQEQDVDEDNVGEFGDDTADLDDANVAAPIGIPVNVEEEVEAQEEEEEEEEEPTPTTPPPSDDDGGGIPLEELPEVVVCVEDVFDCFYTYEECVKYEEVLGIPPTLFFCLFVESERLPAGAHICVLIVDEKGEVTDVSCTPIGI